MFVAIDDSTALMAALGFIQLIVVGLGTWMLITLVKLNATMAALNVTISSVEASSMDYHEYRRWSESKIKQLWAERSDRRRSVGDLPSHGGGDG